MFIGFSLNETFPEVMKKRNFLNVEKKLLENSEKIASFFNLNFHHNKTFQLKDVYRNTIVEHLLLLKFNAENFESRYNIPIYAKLTNGSIYENGYEAFIIKGLRETLWDYKSDSFVKIRLFSYPIDPYINSQFDLYFYKGRFGNIKEILAHFMYTNPEYFEESEYAKKFAKKVNLEPDEKLFKDNFNKSLMYKVFRLMLDIAYDNFPYIKEYAINPAELLIKTAVLTTIPQDKYFYYLREGEETGFSLIHVRMIDEEELILSGLTTYIIDNLKDLISKSIRRQTDKYTKDIKEIQLSMFIFEARQMEQFISPAAFISDLSKLMIYSSPYAFKNSEVDASFRDVHPNQIDNLCPITTGDKANTGLTLHLTCNCKLDKNGRFTNILEKEKKILDSLINEHFEHFLSLCV